ncbi:MAG: DUF1698 domain-containing protein, partial [Gammaproteobacteria bacterium]
MIDIEGLMRSLALAGLATGIDELPARIGAAWSSMAHGDLPKWSGVLENLPEIAVAEIGLNEERVRVEPVQPLDVEQQQFLYRALQELHPWRKGPYQIHGIHIDSEWRSDLKWNRLNRHIASLDQRRVLDVGCGNGYHCWRMFG